jgi:hypothetical protein
MNISVNWVCMWRTKTENPDTSSMFVTSLHSTFARTVKRDIVFKSAPESENGKDVVGVKNHAHSGATPTEWALGSSRRQSRKSKVVAVEELCPIYFDDVGPAPIWDAPKAIDTFSPLHHWKGFQGNVLGNRKCLQLESCRRFGF